MEKSKKKSEIGGKRSPKIETRWNRISKKYQHPNVTTTEVVKKFLDLNYVNSREIENLSGAARMVHLDPGLVMELRHKAIERKSTSSRELVRFSPEVEARKMMELEKRENHKKSLEKVAIESEIQKFKNDLRKFQIKKGSQEHDFSINNRVVYENIVKFEVAHNDFYETRSSAPLIINDGAPENIGHDRMVRFGESVEIVTTTTTSSNLMSLISILADDDDCFDYFCGENDLSNSESNEMSEEATFRSINDDSHDTNASITPAELTDDDDNDLNLTVAEPPRIIEVFERPKNESKPIEESLIIKKAGVERPNLIIGQEETEPQGTREDNDPLVNDTATERNQIISELFDEKYYKATREYEIKILRKYFLKWSVITTIEKIAGKSMNNSESRVKKINDFLSKIREEKRNIHESEHQAEVQKALSKSRSKFDPIMLSKKYQQKFKFQQEVIELQKLKLERQERMITELKLSKMFEESKHSKIEMRNELRNMIRNGAVKLRAKAKCLQIAGNLKQIEDLTIEEKTMQASGMEVPKFLARMQARAMERQMRHDEVKENRSRLEKEREEAKVAAEEAKRLEDEQEKKERLDAMREKRRIEKQIKVQREKDREKYLDDVKKANEFRRIKLLRYYGFDQLKKLIVMKKFNEKKARILRKTLLMRNTFNLWLDKTRKIWEMKKRKASAFCTIYTQRVAFRFWKALLLMAQSKMMVACDLYDLRISEKILCAWNSQTKYAKMMEERKMMQAAMHYNWHLLWKALEHWQRLHIILKIEKETEERRQRWRIKIWELLPDYEPNVND